MKNSRGFIKVSSFLLLDQNGPIQPAGRFRGGPLCSMDRRQWNFFTGERAEPACLVSARIEFDGDGSFLWQIHRVNLSRLGQTISAVVDQFVVGFGFPPLEAGEK